MTQEKIKVCPICGKRLEDGEGCNPNPIPIKFWQSKPKENEESDLVCNGCYAKYILPLRAISQAAATLFGTDTAAAQSSSEDTAPTSTPDTSEESATTDTDTDTADTSTDTDTEDTDTEESEPKLQIALTTETALLLHFMKQIAKARSFLAINESRIARDGDEADEIYNLMDEVWGKCTAILYEDMFDE